MCCSCVVLVRLRYYILKRTRSTHAYWNSTYTHTYVHICGKRSTSKNQIYLSNVELLKPDRMTANVEQKRRKLEEPSHWKCRIAWVKGMGGGRGVVRRKTHLHDSINSLTFVFSIPLLIHSGLYSEFKTVAVDQHEKSDAGEITWLHRELLNNAKARGIDHAYITCHVWHNWKNP